MKIAKLTIENLTDGCVTDACPRFSFALDADKKGTRLERARIEVNGWAADTVGQVNISYGGQPLAPFTEYTVTVTATDNFGNTDTATATFETGRLRTPWAGKWITDGCYTFTESKISPLPMCFKKNIRLDKKVKKAKLYATAMGIYEFEINGSKVGTDYFAPGFTSYKTRLQYQAYDVTDMLTGSDTLRAMVAGGWAVGSFIFTRKNRVTADRQALLAELRITFDDDSQLVVGTDTDWLVTTDTNVLMADFYDGETYDATLCMDKSDWHNASVETLRVSPSILATYGAMVRAKEVMMPVLSASTDSGYIYDFGQNFAGVVDLKIKGRAGQKIVIRHAEILNRDGTLNTAFLRSAKATVTYICTDGQQEYSPRFTYMGFRYISIEGIDENDIVVSARALYSDMEQIGSFSCSNEMLNKLQSNIVWSAKSNFIDIPIDCPQRDERMGWTGDIAAFAPTANYNFDTSRFLEKWLLDVKAEQLKTGGIPNTVPSQGYGFPATMPTMAVDFWGDACLLVPWAEYQARGDKEILRKMYPTMKKYVKACKFWAGFMSVGKRRYIWNTPGVFHFGDWVTPDLPKMQQWQKRRTWTATASLKNTSGLLSKIAGILGEREDQEKFRKISEKTADAYISCLTDGKGKLNSEFQTAYVLPLVFDIFKGDSKAAAAKNLDALVKKNDYCIGTGFPGTPYVLYALADNGYADTAYKMLLNTKCPSWLYEVKVGATTVWERWDGLDENGDCPIGDSGTADVMISYNHYAHGSVGNFLYQRIAGIQQVTAGYRKFKVQPILGGGLTGARGSHISPYGKIVSDWKIDDGNFTIKVTVPVGAECELVLPDGTSYKLVSGSHEYSIRMEK